ncbi:tetratricopeptide repeat protein [Desulfovibrio oxyclinae]|jgi:tetratricopeptide (TPR) repeat protein|uniref:tetratricopeptide repeat protein n=1 Tax=Desulfovibrio oxyclinae TaxID=63560 RepID=UPI000363D5D2|nr:tetratricopeptide repeat protein [Desulfovibrio oxyclinae]
MADKRYDAVVFDYFEKENGNIVLLSEDPLFFKTLRSTVVKTIGTKRDCLYHVQNTGPAAKAIKALMERKMPVVVCVERMVQGKPSTDFILALKNMYPDIRIIVLIGETRRENIAYFYEIGVNNVISKPASVNNIIEKLAFTIKPQGKLSELMHTGKLLLDQGKHKEALGICAKILKLKPGSPAALMLTGDIYLDVNKRDKAQEAYMAAHESSRLYLEPIKKLANFYKGHDQEQYLSYLKKLDRLSPLNTERKCEIGAVHVERDELERAEKYFDQAIDTATKEAMSLVAGVADRVASSVSKVSPRMSEKYLVKVLDLKGDNLSKDDIGTFNRLGIALRSQGKWREAIENYERALTISPNDEGLYYNMGLAYHDGGQRREGIDAMEKALNINPDFFKEKEGVSLNIGNMYVELRRYNDARPFFEEAARINPKGRGTKKLQALKKVLS